MKKAKEILDSLIIDGEPLTDWIGEDGELYGILLFAMKVAQDEAYNQALEDKRELLIDFTNRCLHDLIDAERGGINSEPIIDEYLKLKK